MTADQFALLLGLFVAPMVMLALGHRYHRRPPHIRALFWGCLFGFMIGTAMAVVASVLPPVAWGDLHSVRALMVYWGLGGATAIGAALGLLVHHGLAPQATRR